jgi:hypothetical protein
MIARFHTICRRCSQRIRPGQYIVIPRAGGRAVHAGCIPDPAAGRAAAPDARTHQVDPELQEAKMAAIERSGWR